MKKTLVASALAAVLFVPAASAASIYKDGKDSVDIGGRIGAQVIDTQGETHMANASSRVNISFNRDMGNGWSAFSRLEWGVNPFGNTSLVYNNNSKLEQSTGDFLSNRLGYVGVSNDTYGSLTFGKQWGAWSNVVNGTDNARAFGGSAQGTYTFSGDGASNGTGRADKAVQYRNAFGPVTVVAQVQLKQDNFQIVDDINNPNPGPLKMRAAQVMTTETRDVSYDNTYGLALIYNVNDKLTLTAGGNTGEFVSTNLTTLAKKTDTDYIYGFGAIWGQLNNGLYVAANFNENQNHDTDNLSRLISESKGVEAIVSYNFDNNVRPYVVYNLLKAGDAYESDYFGDTFKRENLVMGVSYLWDAKTDFFIEGRKDLSDFKGADAEAMAASESDAVTIGFRYTI